MPSRLQRVGTIYLPVTNPKRSAEWFCTNLEAELDYIDEGNNHAIISLAHQSFILIQSEPGILANFQTINDGLMFPFTFEVNGESELVQLHKELKDKGVLVEEIEDRGHPGRNFIIIDPDGNRYDVWSELSTEFKEKYNIN
ncbi:VOC family protein [Paenibacillus sedimenti]|uniref:VOC family protein n=1 Tax=Paenibacillus sedimenti TaxID=2770274 RepID=A0A926QJQ0_9BACL|nr:VOC family protein [Paenibacillus sedimenti]MBD0380938.1 VOC family protein [Paenibacillus sedimenti]